MIVIRICIVHVDSYTVVFIMCLDRQQTSTAGHTTERHPSHPPSSISFIEWNTIGNSLRSVVLEVERTVAAENGDQGRVREGLSALFKSIHFGHFGPPLCWLRMHQNTPPFHDRTSSPAVAENQPIVRRCLE